ncbi:MAG: hypothetical protein JO199_05315 [Candidatus Eremiobacteraeota bacterium]|nr:hypothetical protein [Candidatus Eremiobacteraeota bacterium]
MSSGDFASELRQSVQDHIALVHTAATAAKARIGQSIPKPVEPEAPLPPPAPTVEEADYHANGGAPRPAVDFFAEEPEYAEEAPQAEDSNFESALDGPPDALPEGAISFDDDFASNVDDEGIPVWEE